MKELKIPEIGQYVRHIGTLVGIEEIPPKPVIEPTKEYIFEQIDARCEMRHHGETLKVIQTLNDFYGYGTGIETAIKEMKAFAIKKEITPESDLEVVVIKVTSRYRFNMVDNECRYDKQFYDFAHNFRSTYGMPDPGEEIVWSSKGIPDGNTV